MPSERANPVCLGIIRVGASEIAVPAGAIAHVTTGPSTLGPVSDGPACVLGSAQVQGRSWPVVRLPGRPDGDPPAAAPPLLVCLRGQGGGVAVQADQVVGVVRVTPEAICTVAVEGPERAAVFSGTLRHGNRCADVLDADALARLAGVADAPLGDDPAGTPAMAAAGPVPVRHAVFRAGASTFAIDLRAARRATVTPGLIGECPSSPLVGGFVPVDGRPTALIDLPALLGLTRSGSAGPPPQTLVACHKGRALAFGIAAICGIEPYTRDEVRPLADAGLAPSPLCLGVARSARHGTVVVLDADALVSHPDVRSLSHPQEDPAVKAVDTAAAAEPLRCIVYRVGPHALATPLAQVEAVVAVPAGLLQGRAGPGPLAGRLPWQGQSVPLVDLGMFLGRGELGQPVDGCALVVRGGGGQVAGYLVTAVDAIAAAAPAPFPWGAFTPRCAGFDATFPPIDRMLPVRSDGARRNLSILNLAGVRLGGLEPGPIPAARNAA